MTKALKHTDGRIITVNFGELKWSNKTGDDYAHEREGFVDAAGGFKDNGTAGTDGSFTDNDGNTITVSGGIITDIS